MSDVRPIRELLGEVEELRSVLDDLNVKYVRIAANGHWSYEKLGRARHGRETLQRGLLLRLADLIPPGRHLRSGEWALRKYDGVTGPSILIERLPIAVADRLPQDVLATLKRQVKRPGNGVLVGEPGAGKGGLLLWLALQIPDQPVLYVAENPPSEFPGTHVMHVFPPSSDSERRSLERFVRLSPTVMWDRVVRMDDFQTLYGFPGAGRRWFTTDASSVRSALRLLTAAQDGCDARFSTLLHLASSVIGRPEARNLLVRDDSSWSEVWAAEGSVLDLLEAYDSSDIRILRPTELSVPGIDLNLPKVEVAEDFVAEAEEYAEPVMVESSALPLGIPRRPPTEPPQTVEVDMEADEYERNDAVTGMIPRKEIQELRDQGMVPEDSNEIPALRAAKVTEQTRAYVETPAELMRDEVTNPAAYLNSIMPGLDLDEDDIPGPPEMDLEDLRITTMEEISAEDLLMMDEVDDLARDFSEVFEADLDFESLAEEMLSEISDIDLAMEETALTTNPSRLVLFDSPPAQNPDDTDDSDEGHTLAGGANILRLAEMMAQEGTEDRGDSTKEFTLNERLSLMRKRRNDE